MTQHITMILEKRAILKWTEAWRNAIGGVLAAIGERERLLDVFADSLLFFRATRSVKSLQGYPGPTTRDVTMSYASDRVSLRTCEQGV
jgi:hypothetical protein